MWTWGWNGYGQLGHNDKQNRLVPTLMAGEALGGAAAVVVAAGEMHTVAVMIDGALWAWGNGVYGQLGLGDIKDRLVPARVGEREVFNGVQVRMAACGVWHTLAVTKAGDLWSWGEGEDSVLGYNNVHDRLVPTQVEVQHFGHAKNVSAAAGESHSAAINRAWRPLLLGNGNTSTGEGGGQVRERGLRGQRAGAGNISEKYHLTNMGLLRLVGSLKLQVSFAKEP